MHVAITRDPHESYKIEWAEAPYECKNTPSSLKNCHGPLGPVWDNVDLCQLSTQPAGPRLRKQDLKNLI